jgi:hypothetical protein
MTGTSAASTSPRASMSPHFAGAASDTSSTSRRRAPFVKLHTSGTVFK